MTKFRTAEEQRLATTQKLVDAHVAKLGGRADEARFQLLEATACRLGGFDLDGYFEAFGRRPVSKSAKLLDIARGVVEKIDASGIPPALALSALARERLDSSRQRADGAYHTDYRLALRLASHVRDALVPGAKVVDPACGAGILLAATSLAACGPDRILAADWLSESVYASDMSEMALRGTLIALASLTNDLNALLKMRSRWRVQDSLLEPRRSWDALAPGGFDVVIGNPPWEKVKLSRHEFVRGQGGERHYGQSFADLDLLGYDAGRRAASDRSTELARRYRTLGDGEPDLYVAFTELMIGLTKPGGTGALLVPGGVIRSKGTEALRRFLLARSSDLEISVLDNKARFFSIDTRFKFLSISYKSRSPGARTGSAISLSHARWSEMGFEAGNVVKIPRKLLGEVRPDLTVPEVRDETEWKIFLKAQRAGLDISDPDSPWFPQFCREVDMTHARGQFSKASTKNALPVVEGRMIQPHRFGAKRYLGGEGRAARWSMTPPGSSGLHPQFWIGRDSLAPSVVERSSQLRAGFCDITGQTNERTMMAALIPSGVVCGNKVPTVLFPNDPGEDRLRLWVAIVNSLPFDWLLRRVVTTTVNYFLLLGLRLPSIQPDTLPGRRLVEISKKLADHDRGPATFDNAWRIAKLRAEADVIVARAYGLDDGDLLRMLEDFPLLDRGQPLSPADTRSTVTRDLVMATWCKGRPGHGEPWAARVQAAFNANAIPYLPSELAGSLMEVRDAK